jgi:hypothetical protein
MTSHLKCHHTQRVACELQLSGRTQQLDNFIHSVRSTVHDQSVYVKMFVVGVLESHTDNHKPGCIGLKCILYTTLIKDSTLLKAMLQRMKNGLIT